MAAAGYLRTRVAARILALFFVGAMVPVALLALLSHRAVTRQLAEQSEARLLQMADAAAQLVLERLSSTAGWAGDAAIQAIAERPSTARFGPLPTRLPPGVEGLAAQVAGRTTQLVGGITVVPSVTDAEATWLGAGGGLLKTEVADGVPAVYLAIQDTTTPRDLLWTRLAADSIWGAAMTLGADPQIDDLCVLSTDLAQLACVGGEGSALIGRMPEAGLREGVSGVVEFTEGGEEWIAAWRSIYLRSLYGAPEWYVIVSQTKASVMQPVSGFTYNLLWALAVGFALVLLLANRLVTRTMEPLAELMAGTARVSRQDLSVRIDLKGDDEFTDLARAFNSMAAELDRQFRQLGATQAIDRAVIDAANVTSAVGALVDGAGELLSARKSAVLLFDTDAAGRATLYHRSGGRRELTVKSSSVSWDDLAWVPREGAAWLRRPEEAARHLGEIGIGVGTDHVFAAPMAVGDRLVGVAVFTSDPRTEFAEADVARAAQLVDRGAVALNEVRLRRELAELSSEALKALGNTVDAKSRWTAGHSERVTALSVAIADEMGLGQDQLDLLYRGGLLHDIGKIGVPVEILDFPGKLSPEQRRAVEAHPTIGAKIIEPIRLFRPFRSIVLHHHERWDGEGYPDGLAGTEIPQLARVLAVADVYDAMISPRPYRGPLPQDVVLTHIHEGSNTAFDPDVVAAFDRVMAAGWVHDPDSVDESAFPLAT